MRKRSFVPGLALFALVTACLPNQAEASRTVTIPVFARRWVLQHALAPGSSAGVAVHMTLHLANLGSDPQTGKIEMLSATLSQGYFVGTAYYLARWLYLCGDGESGAAGAAAASMVTPPSAVTWTIPPFGVKRLEVGTVFYTTSVPSGLTSDLITLDFFPMARISIDQDRGAVLGSMTPNIDGAWTGVFCGGFTPPVTTNFPMPLDRTGSPLTINGGRPF